MIIRARGSGWPTTFGTVTLFLSSSSWARLRETTRLTAEPRATRAPAAGDCETTFSFSAPST